MPCSFIRARPLPRLVGRVLAAGLLLSLASGPLDAQEISPAAVQPAAGPLVLDSLVALALEANRTVHAAVARVRAARARIPQAGARPDPMLMAGVTNVPVTEPGFTDFMTMKMVGLSQTFPFPGKLRLQTRIAEHELEAAEAHLVGTRLDVARAVKSAYYELAMTDQLLQVVARNQRLVVGLAQATAASYRVGRSGQEDVLRGQIDATRLSDEATALTERRRAVLAELNALLSRPTDTPVREPAVPPVILRLATPDSGTGVRFASTALGARLAGSPFPDLDSLQALAARHNAMLRMHGARVSAQAARAELARKASLPDFDVSVSYGQRTGSSDMVSAAVAIPLPVQKGRRYDQAVTEAEAELAAMEAEHHAGIDRLRADVARFVADLERDRTQLALYRSAILPQAQAALEAATAGFQTGRTDFGTLIERQSALFNYETQYVRALADFAASIAALEETVGQEILP